MLASRLVLDQSEALRTHPHRGHVRNTADRLHSARPQDLIDLILSSTVLVSTLVEGGTGSPGFHALPAEVRLGALAASALDSV